MKTPKTNSFLALFILFIAAFDAHAQLAGNNIPGDFGVKSGSQAPPGIYAGYLLYNYDTSTIVRNNGNELSLANGDISAWAHAPIFFVVSTKKIFGANYGAVIIPSITNLDIEAPRVGLQAGSGYGSGDLQSRIGRRPVAAFGNSDGDLQMLQWTMAGNSARFALFVHHDDAAREYAYDRTDKMQQFNKGWRLRKAGRLSA